VTISLNEWGFGFKRIRCLTPLREKAWILTKLWA